MQKASGINFMFDETDGIIKVVHQLLVSDDYEINEEIESSVDRYFINNLTNYLREVNGLEDGMLGVNSSYLYKNDNKNTLTGMLWRGININDAVDSVINNIKFIITDYINLINESFENIKENEYIDDSIDLDLLNNRFFGFNGEYFGEDFFDELDKYLDNLKCHLVEKYSNYLK